MEERIMKKMTFTFAVLVLAAVSCQKSMETPREMTTGIPVTLTADFGADTKLGYTPSGNIIKSTWDASESISVITLNPSDDNKVVAIDNFTSTGTAGRTAATFTGTFTGGSDATKVIVIYPALESGETAEYIDGTGTPTSAITNVQVGKSTFSSTFSLLKQTADNNCDHLKNYCIASGDVDLTKIKLGELSVSLKFYVPVMKIVATFPNAFKGKDLTKVTVRGVNSSDGEWTPFKTIGWNYVDIPTNYITCPGGGYKSELLLNTNFKVPDSGVATFYIPFIRGGSSGSIGPFPAGNGFKIEAIADGTTLSYKQYFTSDKSVNCGAVYTINATLAE